MSGVTPTPQALVDALRRADLLAGAPGRLPPLTGIGVDSRGVQPGMLYVAVRGSQADGHRFIADAVRRGAAAVVVEQAQASGVPEIVVRDGRLAALTLGAAWYDYPARKLTLVGVTGTNGKTTTAGLLKHLFNSGGTAGSVGTLGAFDGRGDPVESTAGTLTTPGPIDLQATLAELVRRGTTHVAMEASSHSLDQGRLDGLTFAAGDLYQPDAGPSRLPRHDGLVPRRQAQAGLAARHDRSRGGESRRRRMGRAAAPVATDHVRPSLRCGCPRSGVVLDAAGAASS